MTQLGQLYHSIRWKNAYVDGLECNKYFKLAIPCEFRYNPTPAVVMHGGILYLMHLGEETWR
jgi:hypothetical protein